MFSSVCCSVIHGCARMPSVVMRSFGSTTRILRMRSLAVSDTRSQYGDWNW